MALLVSTTFSQNDVNTILPGVITAAASATLDNSPFLLTGSPFRVCATHDSSPPAGQILHKKCPPGTNGRYVTVVKKMTYQNPLALCEVHIRGQLVTSGVPSPVVLVKRSIGKYSF